MDKVKDVLTLQEAAELLGISRQLLSKELEKKSIPHRKIGRSYIFSRSALLKWLEGNE